MSVLTSIKHYDLEGFIAAGLKDKRALVKPASTKHGRKTPFEIAILNDSFEIVKWYIENADEYKITLPQETFDREFSVICLSRSIRMLELLLDNGFIVESNNSKNRTIVGLIRYNAFSDYLLPMAEIVISRGAEINFKDSYRWTPFMQATSTNNIKLMKLLAEKGADINFRTMDGSGAATICPYFDSTVDTIMELGVVLSKEEFAKFSRIFPRSIIKHKYLSEYMDEIIKNDILHLLPDTIKDIFLF